MQNLQAFFQPIQTSFGTKTLCVSLGMKLLCFWTSSSVSIELVDVYEGLKNILLHLVLLQPVSSFSLIICWSPTNFFPVIFSQAFFTFFKWPSRDLLISPIKKIEVIWHMIPLISHNSKSKTGMTFTMFTLSGPRPPTLHFIEDVFSNFYWC